MSDVLREFPWGFRESQYRLLTTSLTCGVPGYALSGSTTTASLLREVWGSPFLEKDWGSLLCEGQDHVHQRLVVQVSEFLSEGVPQSVRRPRVRVVRLDVDAVR